MKQNLLVISIIFLSSLISAQSNYLKLNLLDTHKLIISQSVGLTLSKTDYENIGLGSGIRVGGEYYFSHIDNQPIAARIFFSSVSINGRDSKRVPSNFSTVIYSLGFGPLMSFRIDSIFYPYFSAGIIAAYFTPRQSNGLLMPNLKEKKYDQIAAHVYFELGLKYRLTENWLLNFSTTLFIDDNDLIDDNDKLPLADFYGELNFGISYAFNFNSDSDQDGVPDGIDKCDLTPLGIEVNSAGCPIDSDIDGIPDYRDECPNTQLGVSVDKFGCAIDSDRDGIADFYDDCPSTPVNVVVDDNGCPIDSDSDGVPDYLDLCKDTEANVEVDSSGCPKINSTQDFLESVIVYFDSGSSEIDEDAIPKLQRLTYIMGKYKDITWYIEGHKDNLEKNFNVEPVSQTRAQAVFDYFLINDIPISKLRLIDRGENFSVGDNSTLSGRAENRRVVIFGVK